MVKCDRKFLHGVDLFVKQRKTLNHNKNETTLLFNVFLFEELRKRITPSQAARLAGMMTAASVRLQLKHYPLGKL